MAGVYSFRQGPQYQTADRNEQFEAALDLPLNQIATLGQSAVGGALDSFGLGTAIRDFAIPQGVDVPPDPNDPANMAPRIGPDAAASAIYGGVRDFFNPPSQEQALSEADYKASPFFRSDIPWDAGMTTARAAALATWQDAKKVREFYSTKRPITAFIGGLVGQALDPINYIPIAGPAVKAAAIGKLGTVGGRIAAGALDAAGNTAAFGLATADARAAYGDDVSWQALVTDVAVAALIGGAFGGAGGLLARRSEGRAATLAQEAQSRLSTLKLTQESRIALNEAIDGLVTDGTIRVSPNTVDPLAALSQRANPALNENLFADIERTDLFSTTAVGRLMDNRDLPLQDFETLMRGQALTQAPELQVRYAAAEAKFADAEARVAAIEEPLNARTDADAISLVDPTSGDLVRAIDTELATPGLAAARRVELEQQRGMIIESIGPDVIGRAETDFRIGPTKKAMSARKSLAAARQEYAKARREADALAQTDMARNRALYMPKTDMTPARPHRPPPERAAAGATAAKPDSIKAMAETYQVDDAAGTFLEEPEIAQLEAEGRMTDADRAEMEAATADYENGASYGDALKAAVGCLI